MKPRRLDIEPLEKARWDRIERELRERLEHEPIAAHPRVETPAPTSWLTPRPVVAFVLAGAAAAMIGAVAWERLRPAPHVAEQPPPSTRVETQDAPSHVEFGGSTLDVASHTAARIEGNDATGVLVSLDHGAIDCEVSPRRGRPPFVVRAGDVSVRVVGTHFRVEREGTETHVSVQHGAVEVESHGATSMVRAGAEWPAAPEIAPTAIIEAMPTGSAPSPKPSSIGSVPSSTAVVETPMPSPRERYDRAITLEASRPDEALSIYRDLAAGTGSWAMNALYAEARLELERGNKDSARKLFADYLQRYPTGPNAHDARELSAKLQ